MKSLLLISLIYLSFSGFAHEDDHQHDSDGRFGKGKAIQEVDEEKGFRLSAEALATLQLGFKEMVPSSSGSALKLPRVALVTSRKKTGVYRYRNGFFKFIPVRIQKRSEKFFEALAPGIIPGDRIVTKGTNLIALTDVFSTDSSEYGHGH